jgi:hypothetical protein
VTELWEEHKPFVIAMLVWAVGGLLFLFAVHLPLGAPVSELKADRGSEAALRRSYRTSAPAGIAYDDAHRALTARRSQLDTALAKARAHVEFKPGEMFCIPKDAAQREIEYTKVRDAAVAQLLDLANRTGVMVPSDYDPRSKDKKKDLPSPAETDDLLVHLAMADRVVRAAVEAKVVRLSSIRHKLGSPHPAPLAEREMKVRIDTGLDQLVSFLDQCSRPPKSAKSGGGILVVRSVDIKGAGGATLGVDITLAAVEVGEIKVKVREPKQRVEPLAPGRVIRSF